MYIFLSGKKDQDVYLRNFARSMDANLLQTSRFVKVRNNGSEKIIFRDQSLDAYRDVAFAGLLRGNYHLYDYATKNENADFFYIDHAYFDPGYRGKRWMRIVKNGFVKNVLTNELNTKRLYENFKIDLQPYKNYKDNRNIVVLPPSNTVARTFNAVDWQENIYEQIRKYTDRPIVIRNKNGPVLDERMMAIKSKQIYKHEKTIEQELDEAYCVFAYNSSVALRALERGIPVICERYCPAYPISNKIENIDDLEEYEREKLFVSLSWGQFTIEESRNSKTFRILKSVKQWDEYNAI